MPAPSNRARRFVQRLLAVGAARAVEGVFRVNGPDGAATLPAAEVAALISAGVLAGDVDTCRPAPETRGWLKRALLGEAAFAAQHRVAAAGPEGTLLNLAESPLLRLATAATGEAAPFLLPHQVAAGERVRGLCHRAQMRPRVTISYSAAHVAGSRGRPAEIGELALEAREKLASLHRLLPRDCAEVVLDVCGELKGLQQIESERGWPRRSAKLVLRIGLDRLAEARGIGAVAVGPERGRVRGEGVRVGR